MADSIKIGNLDISAFKVGGNDCSIYLGTVKLYPNSIDYSTEYLTIVSTADDNTISWIAYSTGNTKTIYYSTDKTTWTSATSTTGGTALATLQSGETLYLKGENDAYGYGYQYNYFESSGNFDAQGNIMSLIYGDNFINQTTLTSSYTFNYLFYRSKIVNAENLVLPATTLSSYCYAQMFYGCTSLTSLPTLPATDLTNADRCYNDMYNGCTSITSIPQGYLPATTLSSYCYAGMFLGTSIVTVPTDLLPATTLADNCYNGILRQCTSLTNAPVLPATTLAPTCYRRMFYRSTSLTTAPELPAETLVSACYSEMFRGCSNLNYIKAMFTTTPSTSYTSNWVNGVASSGTFVKNSAATWDVSGAHGIPTNWTVETESS